MLLFLGNAVLFAQTKQTETLELLKYKIEQNIKFDDNQVVEKEYKSRKKNKGIAIMLSVLLPGMGELYANGYSSGKYFTIADGFLWGGLIGVETYANNQEDNYRAFAKTNAGISLNGKSDKYFADISAYLNIYDFNHEKELERNFAKVYNEQTHYWKWKDNAQRKKYRTMWKASQTANNNIRFVLGALLLNRIASAINAIRLVNKFNKNLKTELGWNISFNYLNTYVEPNKIVMNFRTAL